MRKVIVHGSTLGSNFGDCLFAQLVYQTCEKIMPEHTLFYENYLPVKKGAVALSQHYRDVLGYTRRCRFKDIRKSGGVLFMPGGYFGETTTGLKEALLRYYKYVKLGMYAKWLKKPVAIIGVGAGPLSHGFLVRGIRGICNRASVITVRNTESKEYLESIGVTCPIEVTADAAQVIDQNYAQPLPVDVQSEIDCACGQRKKLLIHCVTPLPQIKIMKEKLVQGLGAFVRKHDYAVVFTVDQCEVSRKDEMVDFANALDCPYTYVYRYKNPTEMISLLNTVDMVVTSKLHVGIISCCLNKSVLSFPFNSHKVPRYYRQIGYGERCIPISDLNPDEVEKLCEEVYCKPIRISDEVRGMARRNFEVMEDFLRSVKDGAEDSLKKNVR